MEGKKNLCAMIPAELHARIMAEKEEMKLGTLAEYVERIFTEHFEGGNDMQTERNNHHRRFGHRHFKHSPQHHLQHKSHHQKYRYYRSYGRYNPYFTPTDGKRGGLGIEYYPGCDFRIKPE